MTDHISLKCGTELVGDYRIDRVLGAGGFGITYLAKELALDRQVTIKEYFPSDFAARSDGSEAVPKSLDCSGDYRWGLDRFIEEAQTLAKFDHPHIVRVYRYFRANNTGYMVLHFEEGQSLKTWLKNLKRAPRQKELDAIVPHLLDALELIHEQDFLHRDIAPDNIIIRNDGHPVLIDFGSARGEIASHSKTVSALVKPGYSPYEQYAETSSKQGPWTDIYALGATLYHAVTGKRPPDSPSRMVSDEFVSAREAAVGGYRKSFLSAIDNALKLNIEQRPRSVAAWRRELMAPDPQRRTWLGSNASAEKSPQENISPDKVDGAGSDSAAPAKSNAKAEKQHGVAKPGPSRQGGLIDFLDGLKSKPLAPKNSDAVNARPENKPAKKVSGNKIEAAAKAKKKPESKPGEKRSWRLPTLLRRLGTSRNPIQLKPKSGDSNVPKARAVPTPKPASPRRPGKSRRSNLRPAIFKLLLGIGAASAAVALQDRFPWPAGAKSISITTASIRRASGTQQATKSEPVFRLERAFDGHTSKVLAATFARAGQVLVSASEDGSLKTWDSISGTPLRTIILSDGPAVALDAHQHLVLTGHSNGVVNLWDINTGNKAGSFKRNDAQIWSVAFSGDGKRFAAASHDWKTAVWDITSSKQPLSVLERHNNAVQSVRFASTPSGEVIATASADKTIKLWNASSYKLLRTYRGHRDFVSRLAFSPDGKYFASASLDGNIRVWSTQRRRLYRSYSDSKAALAELSFETDGTTLITADTSGHILLREYLRRQRTHAGLKLDVNELSAFAATASGHRVVAGLASGKLQVWIQSKPDQAKPNQVSSN